MSAGMAEWSMLSCGQQPHDRTTISSRVAADELHAVAEHTEE